MATLPQTIRFYEFGPFRINSIERLLLRDAEVVPLTPKQFDILLVFVGNSSRVVEKEWLMREIWPDTSVEEGNLTTNIYTLRKALGEGANGPQYIQTVPRRGYRFVAEVREVAGGGPPAINEPVELRLITRQEQENPLPQKAIARGGSARQRVKWNLALVGFALFVVTAAIGFELIWNKPSPPASPGAKTIAVLPFKPLLADSRDESLEAGMAEALIIKLSGIKQLVVRPWSSVRKYKALDQDPIEAGRELGVNYVLDGNLQMDGERTRATVRLLSVKDGFAVWTDKCEELCSTILELQDAIAERIAARLEIELTGEERKRLANHYTESTEAYRAYLTGRLLHHKRTRQATVKSIEYFEQAIKLDPSYALAYAALANAYLSLTGLGGPSTEQVLPKAKEAVAKALEIDDTLAEAHAARGSIKFREWDWSGAEGAFNRANELNPNYEHYHSDYEHYLRAMKRFDEAVIESKRVLELEPASAFHHRSLAMAFYFARQYDEAIEQCQKALVLEQNMPTTYKWLAKSYEQKKLYDQAVEGHLKNRDIGPEVEAAFREAYAASGWKGFWRKTLDLLKEQAKQTGRHNPYQFAETYARLGEKDQAFAWLEKTYEQRGTTGWGILFFNRDPLWDGFRSDPRFIDIIRRMGLEP